MLKQDISRELQRLGEERSLREMRPITEAKRYIQQHYQKSLRLEDVSSAVGFNATYFSTLFKKETGQNFLDYLTELPDQQGQGTAVRGNAVCSGCSGDGGVQ